MEALINAIIYTGDERIEDSAIILEGGYVKEILRQEKLPPHMTCHDLGGGILAPGFIDLQVNGGGDILFSDSPSLETLERMVKVYRRFGTTGFVPTMLSDTQEKYCLARDAVYAARKTGLSDILGIHFEGPYLNIECRGIHGVARLYPPETGNIFTVPSVESGCTLVTLAPEVVSREVVCELIRRGVKVLAGHSNASYDQLIQTFDLGLSGVTHLFNGMQTWSARSPGVVGAALDDDRIGCSIIGDGHHVHAAMIRMAWKCKPRGKLFLISDGMPPLGGETDSFSIHGERIHVREGCCLSGDGRFAGSAKDMATCIRYCVESVGLPLEEVLCMASTYPADFLGLGHRHGRIAAGRVADIVVLDKRLKLQGTWVAGKYYHA